MKRKKKSYTYMHAIHKIISTNLFKFMFFKLNYNRHNMIKERKNGAKKLKGTKENMLTEDP